MKRLFFLLLLAFCGPAWADTVVLKDGQTLDCDIKGHDRYSLDVQSRKGVLFHIPWEEIKSVTHSTTAVPADAEQSHLTSGQAEVTSRVAAIPPEYAFDKALWPGVLIHGWGHHIAHDEERYYGLLAAEVSGVVIAGFGVPEMFSTDKPSESRITSQTLSIAGGTLFLLSWLGDLAFAESAARSFNAAHNLALAPGLIEGRPALAMRMDF
jgi:hypothetical protein